MILIKRHILLQCLKTAHKDQLFACLKTYPNDHDLHTAFCQQLEWRSYKEKLISNLNEKKGSANTNRKKSLPIFAKDDKSHPIDM